jgi:PAS domain S-box-containing protein
LPEPGPGRTGRDRGDEFEATSRLAAIVESSADAMIGKTLEGVITSWNSGAERIYGYTAEEIIGRNISVLIPSGRPDELPAMLQRVAGGERVEHYETERICKNGTVRDVSVSISPIRDRAGAIVGASTVTHDITDRKRADADLRDLQDRLHQGQRLESVGQLAGGIAHDFNNLLAGIMNYCALVSDGLTELTSRLELGADETMVTLERDVAEIVNVSSRAARLTHQLLIFSRREVIKPEILDLNAVVIDMEELLRRTVGESVNLVTGLAPELPRTKGDEGQFEQILMNLAVNARDAMTEGGTLRIETAGYEADDDYALQHGISRGQYVRLSVSDTGCGMPQEVAARAFEPFFTTKAKGEGTGLGLAIVYGIATQAGGNVVISSQPAHGTNVEVILPSTRDFPLASEDAPLDRALASRGQMILLVENEAVVREPTRRILIGSGYAVLAASSAEEALRIAAQHVGKIELLLTDVVMPGGSGKDLAADLSRMSPRTKVLYMSGYASQAIRLRAVSGPGLNLIEKPFASDDLLQRVHAVLNNR